MFKPVSFGIALALLVASPAMAQTPEQGGSAYQRGDYAAALKETWPQATRGNAEAQNNLGLMYYRGHGLPQDRAEAVSWFRKAAEQGHARARSNLEAISEASGDVAPESPPESTMDSPPETVSETPSKSAPESLPEISPQARLAPAGEDFRVQFGAFRSRDLAENEARRLNGIHKPALGDLTISADRADLGRRGVFYRLRAGSFKDRAAAKDFCRKLLGKNQSCIVVRP